MPRIAIIDTYYPDFVKSLPDPTSGTYDTELKNVLNRCFGTFDSYSHYLHAEDWTCIDVIANHDRLQRRWAMENNFGENAGARAIALAQIEKFKPDVVFMQDLSFFDAASLAMLKEKYVLAGQCSCPMPKNENVSKFDVLFTSFPHYVERLKKMGVGTVQYLPLAFDGRLLSEESPKKQFEISFVGGVGANLHWKAGTAMLERVAEEFRERFVWFGYGRENLKSDSPLIAQYAGPAWGRDLYSAYGRSKIVINRHGEVAEGYANNLRMYEATGMGAMLMTEVAPNLRDLFPFNTLATYDHVGQLIDRLHLALHDDQWRSTIAKKGQAVTLANHGYTQRMKTVSDTLIHRLNEVAA